MDKYDEIISRLSDRANRKRDMKQAKAKAEFDSIDREYTAYIDGVYDAVKAIRNQNPPTGKEGSNE